MSTDPAKATAGAMKIHGHKSHKELFIESQSIA